MQSKDKHHLMSSISIALIMASFLVACGDSPQLNRSPLFESSQDWSPGFTKATGQGAGVVVGPGPYNPNVLSQRISIKPNEQFKIVARASSVGKPKAMGGSVSNENCNSEAIVI